MTTVSLQGFGWQYATRTIPALSNISFEIQSGERVLILGASGSGKSTLLRGIAGVLGDDEGTLSGTITIDGISSQQARGSVGLVGQDPHNNIVLEKVGDDVAFGLENLGIASEEIWPKVKSALDQVGLQVELGRSTQALSGGQKQRLALAGVIAMEPKVIALDEPTSHLDPEGVNELLHTLQKVAHESDVPMIIVEHRVDLWWHFATRIIVVGSTGVLWDGPPHKLRTPIAQELEALGVWLPQHIRRVIAPTLPQPRHTDVTVQTRALEVGYDREQPVTSIRNMHFSAGHIHAITGPNGSGKTATALTVAGLLPAVSGEIIAHSSIAQGLGSHPFAWKSRELLSRIGYVFQAPEHQFVTGSVRRELEVGLRALKLPREEIQTRVEEYLVRLKLRDLADVHPFTLSGGQQRRLSVATALITKPHVLICDEPTFGQDATTWLEMVHLFLELRDGGHTLIVVTHDEDFVNAVADEIYVVGGGNEKH